MSLSTLSKFYYGHTVGATNYAIDFDEGGAELQASIAYGDYTITEYLTAVKTALDSAGALTYTVTLNRTTRIITISSTSNFTLRANTGTRATVAAWAMLGYTTVSNKTGASTYAAQNASGSEYIPQALLQEHVPSENWLEKNDAVVNESASGIVQVVYFGDVRFIQFNIMYATNLTVRTIQGSIENQSGGLTNLRTFMDYITTKSKFEFIPDRDTPATFYKVLLDKTDESKNGISYKLKELKNGPNYFETGKLILRVVT
jgi:hypothetical protein